MEIFYLTLQQMLMMFAFIAMGFLLRKTRILPDNSDMTMSRLETHLILPALNFFNQLTNCTVETFKENSRLILYGAAIVAAAMLLAQPLAALFIPKARGNAERSYQRNIYRYAMTFGNYGFMGNFIVLGIWGSEGLFKYSLFCLIITLICNTWGLYLLVPKELEKGFGANLVKGLTAPPTIAFTAGCIGGLLNIKGYVPGFLMNALSNASGCMGPIAMVLTGFVIGGYSFKSLLSDKKVYVATFLRLIVIPAAIMLVLGAIGTDKEIMTLALIAFATPLGLNTIIFPATYGGDTRTGASMAMISQVLSVITIPVMYYVFIVALS